MRNPTNTLVSGLMALGLFVLSGGGNRLDDTLRRGDAVGPFEELPIAGKMDVARDLAVDSRENVYVTGYSYRVGSHFDFVTAKYDANGRPLWNKRYDGPARFTDYAETMVLAGDGGVAVAGHSSGLKTSLDMTVVRYDPNGNRLWVARYDGPSHRDDYAQDIVVDERGCVIVTGYSFGAGTEYDFITVKYDPQGRQIWEARHNASINRDDSAKAIALDSKGFVYVTGTDREGKTSYDFATIKYDGDGRELWTARYSGPDETAFDAAEALAVDDTGGVYVTGYGYNGETEYDIITMKYDVDGGLVWSAVFNGPADRIDKPAALALDGSGNAHITGYSMGLRSAADIVTIKYDRLGRQVWAIPYDGPDGRADGGRCIAVGANGSVVIAGSSRGLATDEDIILIKYDADGKLLWESRYDGPDHGEDRAAALSLDARGNSYVAGYSYGEKTEADFIILKYDPQGRLLWLDRLDGATVDGSKKE